MDTLQLNKINELAREYLRLGIAKGTSDAVEKARFQLAFEKEREAPPESPYESFFPDRHAQQSHAQPQQESPSPLDAKRDRYDELNSKLGTLESETGEKLRSQQARIAQLEETITSLKREIAKVRDTPAPAPVAAPIQEPERNDAADTGPIASTIEQTIKGRTISSADVSVDKIFYFGNR